MQSYRRWLFGLSIMATTMALSDTGPVTCIDDPARRTLDDPPTSSAPSGVFDPLHPEWGFFQPEPGAVEREKAALESCSAPPDEGFLDEASRPFDPNAACADPENLVVTAGVRDNYALPYDATTLTPAVIALAGFVPPGTPWIGFDSDQFNYRFGHHFRLNFTSLDGYQSGKLTLHLRPIGELYGNDSITLKADGARYGWGTTMAATGLKLETGKEVTLELDLRALSTGTSTILADVSRYKNLMVFFEDDIAIDDMTLSLSCSGGPDPLSDSIVGVIPNSFSGGGCGAYKLHEVFLDNEDRRTANKRGGWRGETVSDLNTLFRLCAVPGEFFTQAADAGANFAVVSLSPKCPPGLTRFDRFHDNENTRPAAWDTAPGGSPTRTLGNRDTNMAFCVATGSNYAVANRSFPIFGFGYGVFGARSDSGDPVPAWVLPDGRGWLYLDDEDTRNGNGPRYAPAYTRTFVETGPNTWYYLARVK